MSEYLPLWYESSVTIFGEIPPLWQNFKSLGQIFESVSIRKLINLIWPTFMPFLANDQIWKKYERDI